jgi:hypothetical protein
MCEIGGVRCEVLEGGRVEVGFFEGFFVVVTVLLGYFNWDGHFDAPHDFAVAVFGGEEVVGLTAWFGFMTLCVLDDGAHQFDVL